MSFGGGGLLVLAIIGLFVAEAPWLRILCGVVVGLYVVFVVVALVTGQIGLDYVVIPIVLVTFGWFVQTVVKGYGKY